MVIKIDYLNKNILIGFLLLVIIILFLFNTSLLSSNHIFKLLLVMVLFLLASLSLRRSNKFIAGQTGEKDIEFELKKLGENFVCINSGLETGRGNIDKIVIGPTGVWTLEVKSHKGNIIFERDTLLINNHFTEKDFLKQAYAEAKYLEDLIKEKLNLQIKVQPVLVFSNKFAKVNLGLKTYKGVYVVGKNWLNKLITETHTKSLGQETILKIKNLLS
ncbi:hypothetical protein A2159_01880 [Candidatus Woesebacteria bacterium RBG_13_34_9]|uniref:NERD domain-containing protein n=1 Tax=Candidatus Woesebacteria bacterium RBG_13_34_9 TaxID=1802477 RepID=A0A1F7WZ51_9BACT|nr:MAG: hypothetical protein A2159_01880 [Candidatus Woesebacteria bacterium RBG_13_34_9]